MTFAYNFYFLSSIIEQSFALHKQKEQEMDILPLRWSALDQFIDELARNKSNSSLIPLLTVFQNRSSNYVSSLLPSAEFYRDEILEEDPDFILDKQARCRRYGYRYVPSVLPNRKRRRIFFGSLIADDSWHVIAIHAAEAYGLYDTVAFIESNVTQNGSMRKLQFYPGALKLDVLQGGLFGPDTKVTVDMHQPKSKLGNSIFRENMQREDILMRWKKNGMNWNDIGIIGDVDEVFTRDFLLALKTCDIPQFRPGQNCNKPKLSSYSQVLELTLDCLRNHTLLQWRHPDVITGECVDRIGDINVHKPGPRAHKVDGEFVGPRKKGYGTHGNDYGNMPNISMYPLWKAVDFRSTFGGEMKKEHAKGPSPKTHTGYHFHNFFDSFDVMRRKYKTYGHAKKYAEEVPLGKIQEDIELGIRCIMGRPGYDLVRNYERGGFETINRRSPVMYKNKVYLAARDREMVDMIKEDELKFGSLYEKNRTQ